MMSSKKHLVAMIALTLAMVMTLIATMPMVYSWLSNPTISDANVDGSIKGSYFEDGDGSEEHPYIIARPIQLYYLAWLQDIGYFNKEDGQNAGHMRQFWFELRNNYTKSGYAQPLPGAVTDGIFDMTEWNLPPIGTTEFPFVGHFNGNGLVVANLHVTNTFTSSDKAPKEGESTIGTQALGFFGVVGSVGTAGTVGSLAYDAEDNGVTNIVLHNLTVESAAPASNQTLVGLAAGYVNAPVTQIAVSESQITVADTVTGPIAANTNGNESDFGLVGFCTSNYKEDLNVERVTISLPTYTQNVLYKKTQDEGPGFGGSIKMQTVYDRLVSVFSNNAEYPQYVDKEYWTANEQTGVTTHHTERDETNGVNQSIKAYNPTDVDYSYTFSTYSSSSSTTTYMYLFGEDTIVGQNASYPNTSGITKTVETERYKRFTGTAYTISAPVAVARDGGGYTIAYTSGGTTYYLNTNGSTISAGTDPYAATAWTLPNSGSTGAISTTINGTTYYLRRSNTTTSTTLEVTSQTANTNIWYRNGSKFYVTYNSRYYYIRYSGGWGISSTNRTSSVTSLTVADAQQEVTYYLNINAAGTGLTYGTDAAAATKWAVENSYYYTIVNDTVKYLNATGTTTVSVGNTASSTWTYSNNRLYSYYNYSNRYIRFNNGWSLYNSTTYAATFTRTSTTMDEWAWVTETTTEASSFTTKPTYFALNMSNAFATNDNNTGYVISGANFKNTTASNTSERYPSKSGDIRVSEYNMAFISNSLQNGTAYNDGGITSSTTNITYSATYDKRLEILTAVHTTYNGTTYDGFYRITDTDSNYNTTHSYVNSKLSGYTAVLHSTLGLKRYSDARAELSSTFLNSNKIYGLHFMDAVINKNNTVTIPNAKINGETISNYQVPIDCIDFNVKNRGFLTIFAGTYFTGNTSFFSLHEIFRYKETDSEVIAGTKQVNDIKDIKEISKIYRPLSGTNDYIYLYANGGGYSKELTASQISSLVLAFDMDWMTNPGSDLIPYVVYYFEIPVNGGEFALGSVEGKDGAYLFYLDIAANGGAAEDKDRTTVAEQFTTKQMTFSVPKGVQLVAGKDSYPAYTDYNVYSDYLDSVAVKLSAGFTGTVPFSRTSENVFNFTPTGTSVLTYVGGTVSATTGFGGEETAYYPNGYTVKLVETITDVGRTTGNTDHMRLETLDTYNSSGVRTSRTVTLYAGVDSEENIGNIVKIVSFTYDPTGHDSMITRVVRAASIGGFNIAFSEAVTITATLENENAHVNFGDNTANVLITLSADQAVSDKLVPAVNLSDDSNGSSPYRKSAIGADFVSYDYYYNPSSTVTATTAPTFTPTNNANDVLDSLSLSYAITLTSVSANTAIKVYAKLLQQLSPTALAHTTWVRTADQTTTESKSVPITVTGVTVNGNSLTYNTVTTLNLGS